MTDDLKQSAVADETISISIWGFHPEIFVHRRKRFLEFLAVHGADDNAEVNLPFVVEDMNQPVRHGKYPEIFGYEN